MDRPSWSLDPMDRMTPLTHFRTAAEAGSVGEMKMWPCREQINLAGLGNTSCGRSLLFCPLLIKLSDEISVVERTVLTAEFGGVDKPKSHLIDAERMGI